jgi:hypothetical protein
MHGGFLFANLSTHSPNLHDLHVSTNMLYSTLNFTWGPPDPSVLSFSDCEAVGSFWSNGSDTVSLSFPAIYNLLVNGLETYLQEHNLADPPMDELFLWMNGDIGVNTTIGDQALDHCLLATCRLQGFEGNPDIAGIGVLTSKSQAIRHSRLTSADAGHLLCTSYLDHALYSRAYSYSVRSDTTEVARDRPYPENSASSSALNLSISKRLFPVFDRHAFRRPGITREAWITPEGVHFISMVVIDAHALHFGSPGCTPSAYCFWYATTRSSPNSAMVSRRCTDCHSLVNEWRPRRAY